MDTIIKKNPNILGFFIIITFGGETGGFYHTNWLDDPLLHQQNCHNYRHHFEISCMALFYKMDLLLLLRQLNEQRDKLGLCIFFVSQSTYTTPCPLYPFQIFHHFWIDFFLLNFSSSAQLQIS